jgi:hypothetical protein
MRWHSKLEGRKALIPESKLNSIDGIIAANEQRSRDKENRTQGNLRYNE